jgi:hypothetical protein
MSAYRLIMATHHFQASLYHITIGPHQPVLRIADGDQINHGAPTETLGRKAGRREKLQKR